MNKENAERIVRVLDAIDKSWSKVSDWRFGQLISNLEKCVGRDLFYISDDDFIKLINSYVEDINQWTEEEYNEGSRN